MSVSPPPKMEYKRTGRRKREQLKTMWQYTILKATSERKLTAEQLREGIDNVARRFETTYVVIIYT